MPEQILEDWLLHCAALLHEVHATDDALQRALDDVRADETPLDFAHRLVAVWLARQREAVAAVPHEADWPDEAELLRGQDEQLLVGMMLCLLGAHRQALPRLHAAALPPWVQGIALVWRARMRSLALVWRAYPAHNARRRTRTSARTRRVIGPSASTLARGFPLSHTRVP